MAITVTKSKKPVALQKPDTAEQASLVVAELSLEALADLYGSLEQQVETANRNPIYARMTEVKKALAAKLESELGPGDAAELSGEHWTLDISAAARNPREINEGAIPLVQGFLGDDVFAQVAKVGLADLDKYLTPGQLAVVVNIDTGFSSKRKITCKFKG